MKILLRDPWDNQCYWVGEKGLKHCTDITDSSLAGDYNEEDAQRQIDWYADILQFEVEWLDKGDVKCGGTST